MFDLAPERFPAERAFVIHPTIDFFWHGVFAKSNIEPGITIVDFHCTGPRAYLIVTVESAGDGILSGFNPVRRTSGIWSRGRILGADPPAVTVSIRDLSENTDLVSICGKLRPF